MSFDLIKDDPLVGTTFFLEIGGETIANLTSVDGLAMEIETSEINQRTTNGNLIQHTTMAKPKYTGALTLKRYAPLDSTNDTLWKWFVGLRSGGMSASGRDAVRKSGSVVLYDTTMKEVSRWNFTECWPSKIENDGLDVTKNDPLSETITLQYETLARVK